MATSQPHPNNSIVDAPISALTTALATHRTTAVDLALSHLLRIATYDIRNTALNSTPLLNPHIFDEAAASDARRAAGTSLGPLDGIPFTVKDSYKVRGMTVASGSEAFQSLTATSDAHAVSALRDGAGAVLVGKTNMCPMAFGGMQRGVYGRAESPYNSRYLAAAFASGSSNGSGVATASSFAAFGMAEETVSSGRSPASNNGLVAYTPSRGVVSIRGNWPLYPTCDVVVPHTRCVDDLLMVLDAVATEDGDTVGDFWRDQPFVDVVGKWREKRPESFVDVKEKAFLSGKRIAVPAMYVRKAQEEGDVYTSDATIDLWNQAKADLEACGAEVEVVEDFPVMRLYDNPSTARPGELPEDARLPEDWNSSERGTLIAHAWDDFLRTNNDPVLSNLAATDWTKLFPQLPLDHPQMRFSEVANAVHWSKLASYVESNARCAPGKSQMYNVPNLQKAVLALENMRKKLFEDWMDHKKFDFVAFPAAGDVGYADADVDVDLARHTWQNGVKYSNGNRCLRHLGIPSITVPMGILQDKQMPMGLTILGRAYEDVDILKAGWVFERIRQRRSLPPRTPALSTDVLGRGGIDLAILPPHLEVDKCSASRALDGQVRVAVAGIVESRGPRTESNLPPAVEVYIDGNRVPKASLKLGPLNGSDVFSFQCEWTVPCPPVQDERNAVVGKIARDQTMIIITARSSDRGRPAAILRLIDVKQ